MRSSAIVVNSYKLSRQKTHCFSHGMNAILLVEMLRAYKYRLYPTAAQQMSLAKHFGCCRWVYNWALDAKTKAWQDSKQRLTSYDLITQLPKLKKQAETEWLREVNSQALQQSVIHLELAFDRFFKTKKGYPKFKSKRDNHQSFSCPQGTEVDFKTGTIYLPKLDWVKVVLSRPFKGKIKTVSVSRTPTGKYFVSVLVEDGKELPAEEEVHREDHRWHRLRFDSLRHSFDRREDREPAASETEPGAVET